MSNISVFAEKESYIFPEAVRSLAEGGMTFDRRQQAKFYTKQERD